MCIKYQNIVGETIRDSKFTSVCKSVFVQTKGIVFKCVELQLRVL